MVTMHSMQRLLITSLQNGNVIMSVENHKCSENVPEVNSEGLKLIFFCWGVCPQTPLEGALSRAVPPPLPPLQIFYNYFFVPLSKSYTQATLDSDNHILAVFRFVVDSLSIQNTLPKAAWSGWSTLIGQNSACQNCGMAHFGCDSAWPRWSGPFLAGWTKSVAGGIDVRLTREPDNF